MRRGWLRAGAIAVVGLFGAALITAAVVVANEPADARKWLAETRESLHLSRRVNWWRLTLEYSLRNPVRDAHRAIRVHDTRLLAGATLGGFIPGADPNAYDSLNRRYGSRLLYAGCVVEGGEGAYRQAATQYAAKYNRVILAEVKR